jgi:hypothetical protein
MINIQKLHFLNIGKPLRTKIHDFDKVATMMIWGSIDDFIDLGSYNLQVTYRKVRSFSSCSGCSPGSDLSFRPLTLKRESALGISSLGALTIAGGWGEERGVGQGARPVEGWYDFNSAKN